MNRPAIGVVAVIQKKNKILLGLRKGPHAKGMWGLPGGHLEGGEFFDQCAIRETEEETGIILPSARLLTVINTVYHSEQKHYVVVFMTADMPDGQEARVMEPKKCERWEWFKWNRLPSPLMPGIVKLVEMLRET